MATVQINQKEGNMTITFEGKAHSGGIAGVCSQASWDNQDMMPSLRKLFHCTPDERIVAIVVDNFGISAQFERS